MRAGLHLAGIMATKKKGRTGARKRRQTYVFVSKKTRGEIREYSKFAPGLSKLKGKSRITSAERAQLTRLKKALRHTENLKPLTEKQAKALAKAGHKDLLVGNGVRAIRLRNTSPEAKIRIKKDGLIITSNGRTWEYHPVAAEIGALADYGIALLERGDVAQINLWTNRGRANEGFSRKQAWLDYLHDRFAQYVSQTEFTEGIAARIKDKKNGGK